MWLPDCVKSTLCCFAPFDKVIGSSSQWRWCTTVWFVMKRLNEQTDNIAVEDSAAKKPWIFDQLKHD